jgi:hypothetical protein
MRHEAQKLINGVSEDVVDRQRVNDKREIVRLVALQLHDGGLVVNFGQQVEIVALAQIAPPDQRRHARFDHRRGPARRLRIVDAVHARSTAWW